VNLNAAGIDVGATAHYVAVPEGRDEDSVRCFETFTADLEALADWLKQCGVQTVAMESTGVYWIPVFEVLEARGFEVKLVEPGKLKSVPGRKTDVLDCQWIQQLHTYGLLQGSFVPPEKICMLRSYMRQRGMLVEYAGQHVLHMQKALMQMNVQLHHVISDITGATGLRIIDAILAGERDPHQLAKLRHPRCKKDQQTIAMALEGHWRDDHLFALKQAAELYRFYHRQLAELDGRLESYLATFEDRSDGKRLRKSPKPKAGSNAPDFDIRNHLYKMTGVDLTTIDGISGYAALQTAVGNWHGHEPMAHGETLCVLVVSLSGQQENRGPFGQRQITSQRQPGRGRVALGRPVARPCRLCPRRILPSHEGQTGSAQSHHGDGPQTGENRLQHAPLRKGIRRRWSGIL
jgi:transposase